MFFCESNKRLQKLHTCNDSECLESSLTRLKQQCTTRWVDKQTAVFIYKELYPAVVVSLDDMTLWTGETDGKAAMCVRSLDHGFVIALEELNMVLAKTKPLSVKLQGVSQDIHNAVASVKDLLKF